MTEFLFPIKKKIKIVIPNVYVAKILLKDMLNNKLIKNNYYECNEIFGINVIAKIKEYFDNYKEEEIIKAYLYDMYGIGEKIMSSKFILTDKHKYGYSIKDIHKRMMEIIDDTDEEPEIITEDFKNALNKKNVKFQQKICQKKNPKLIKFPKAYDKKWYIGIIFYQYPQNYHIYINHHHKI